MDDPGNYDDYNYFKVVIKHKKDNSWYLEFLFVFNIFSTIIQEVIFQKLRHQSEMWDHFFYPIFLLF